MVQGPKPMPGMYPDRAIGVCLYENAGFDCNNPAGWWNGMMDAVQPTMVYYNTVGGWMAGGPPIDAGKKADVIDV